MISGVTPLKWSLLGDFISHNAARGIQLVWKGFCQRCKNRQIKQIYFFQGSALVLFFWIFTDRNRNREHCTVRTALQTCAISRVWKHFMGQIQSLKKWWILVEIYFANYLSLITSFISQKNIILCLVFFTIVVMVLQWVMYMGNNASRSNVNCRKGLCLTHYTHVTGLVCLMY